MERVRKKGERERETQTGRGRERGREGNPNLKPIPNPLPLKHKPKTKPKGKSKPKLGGWMARISFLIHKTATLETTQGQEDGFFGQLLVKCYLPEIASVED